MYVCIIKCIRIYLLKSSKAIPVQPCFGSVAFQEVKALRFLDGRHMKVVRLSALHTSCLYPQEIFLVLMSGKKQCGQKDYANEKFQRHHQDLNQ
jgi:hypothetical protein